jgi:hypothetical protein
MARRYRGEGRSVGAAQIWALSYFDVADAFPSIAGGKTAFRLPSPHRPVGLYLVVLHDSNVRPVVVRCGCCRRVFRTDCRSAGHYRPGGYHAAALRGRWQHRAVAHQPGYQFRRRPAHDRLAEAGQRPGCLC